MNSKQSDRRRFLKEGAVLAGLAAGAIRSASGQGPMSASGRTPESEIPENFRFFNERSRFENSVRKLPSAGESGASKCPLQDLHGIITPSDLHFVAAYGMNPPDIAPREHRLLIHGLVHRPLIFTLEELKRLPSVSRIHLIECVTNSYMFRKRTVHLPELRNRLTARDIHGNTSCSEWTGVPLSLLLQEAGVKNEASWIVAEGAEPVKHARSIPLNKVMDDVIVAYAQNGEAIRRPNGYPLKLLVPGFEGAFNIKWLRRIKVVDQPYLTNVDVSHKVNLRPDGKMRWYNFEMPPKSVITRPSGEQRLPSRGFYEITGLAWSGGGTIRRVEVSTDGGRNWKDAQLQEPVLRIAHTRFRFPWNWDGGEAVLQSRCTDDRGVVQPTLAELGKIWGVNFDWEYWKIASETGYNGEHFNVIQPWKVTREGTVLDAMYDAWL
ncbi:MAG: sulfite dehydrogenase [Acidobacteria bacterium RIFCSPLOWO2_12_FULL_60_22]|nr:MAG: sulfite dehydrogenase [Acidobacteria bacterium RIFCSPLOWO2_12_FULL_60_22]